MSRPVPSRKSAAAAIGCTLTLKSRANKSLAFSFKPLSAQQSFAVFQSRASFSEAALAYRTRLRLQISPEGEVGLFAPQSHRVVPVDRCEVCKPELNEGLARFVAWARKNNESLAAFASAELRCAPQGPKLSLHLRSRTRRVRAPKALKRSLPNVFQLWVDGKPAGDAEPQRWPLAGGLELAVPANVFVQIHPDVNQLLVAEVVECARHASVRKYCDLYCGAGNFALALSAAGLAGIGVEESPAAVRAARQSARELKVSELRLVRAKVEDFTLENQGDCDLVLLDPPRRGALKVVRRVGSWSPRCVALCYCDPVALARDIGPLLGEFGYRIRSLTVYDMFPQTHHFETLAWLER